MTVAARDRAGGESRRAGIPHTTNLLNSQAPLSSFFGDLMTASLAVCGSVEVDTKRQSRDNLATSPPLNAQVGTW